MRWMTHEVQNQVPDLENYNLYTRDVALSEAVQREGAQWHSAQLQQYGQWLGTARASQWAHEANQQSPQAQIFDNAGHRVDRVQFSHGWHSLMKQGFAQGMHCLGWSEARTGAHVARAATYLLHGQIEAGSLCPITMTSAAIPVLQKEDFFSQLQPRLFSRDYDAADVPLGNKQSMMVGMGLTEKQGGSDLRQTSTTARALGSGGRGAEYSLVGHKWFFSSPVSDAHLVLARHEDSLSCFYVPRWLPDGTKNAVALQRLKNKLGNASNASAEVEFHDAYSVLIGEPGRGIATLIEMAAHTRLDCVYGSTALLRQAVVQALHHARHRKAFGALLIHQPLMRSVLADLIIESEAATALALRLARSLDHPNDPLEQAYLRLLVPAAKFWICKRTTEAVAECLEVLGGNGYIEEGPLARLYREAPVNSIWEGSGNVMCLDVLRGLAREPALAEALADSLLRDSADDPFVRSLTEQLLDLFSSDREQLEPAVRYLVQQLILLVQANLLRRHAPHDVADGFIQTRLKGAGGRVYGTIPQVAGADVLLDRAWAA